MAKIKKVRLTVSSQIDNLDSSGLPEGEAEKTAVTAIGYLKEDGEDIYISYNEQSEGGAVLSDIRLCKSEAIVTRHGAIESFMRFSEGVTYKTRYTLPPYSFDMEITTKRMTKEITQKGITLKLLYKMTVGGAEKLCRMTFCAEYCS